MPVSVRPARLADRAAVQRIASLGMRQFGVEPDFEHLDRELGAFGAVGNGVAQLVGERDGAVIASLILSRKDEKTLKLSAFYVAAELRGLGIGRAMLERAIEIARGLPCEAIYLETWSTMTAALRLYTALGWRRHQRLDPASGAEWSYLLQLKSP